MNIGRIMCDLENLKSSCKFKGDCMSCNSCNSVYEIGEYLNKLRNYELLEDNGLLHIAPCKNGTEIFYLTNKDFMDFEKIVAKGSYLNGFTEYYHGEVGVGFFLTRDEADEKLKEIEINE